MLAIGAVGDEPGAAAAVFQRAHGPTAFRPRGEDAVDVPRVLVDGSAQGPGLTIGAGGDDAIGPAEHAKAVLEVDAEDVLARVGIDILPGLAAIRCHADVACLARDPAGGRIGEGQGVDAGPAGEGVGDGRPRGPAI